MMKLSEIPGAKLITETDFPSVGEVIYITNSLNHLNDAHIFRIALVLSVEPPQPNTKVFNVLYVKQFYKNDFSDWDLENVKAQMSINTILNMNFWYCPYSEEIP